MKHFYEHFVTRPYVQSALIESVQQNYRTLCTLKQVHVVDVIILRALSTTIRASSVIYFRNSMVAHKLNYYKVFVKDKIGNYVTKTMETTLFDNLDVIVFLREWTEKYEM